MEPGLEDEINRLQQTSWGPGYSGAFLNGRPLPVDKNDLFSLLQVSHASEPLLLPATRM